MTLLAAILPGFRDIRSQFLVGAMWVVSIVLGAISARDHLQGILIYQDLLNIWSRLPQSIRLGILATSVYLLGMILPPWSATLIAKVRRRIVKSVLGGSKRAYSGKSARIILHLRSTGHWLFPPAHGSDALISSAIRGSLPEQTSSIAASLVGPRIVGPELDLAALRLSKDSPEQYQQYDRIKSEGEFRTSVSPAIAAITFAISQYAAGIVSGIAILLVGLGSALTIARQGHLLRSDAESLIATAIYLRWTGTPTIDGISKDLAGIHSRRGASVAKEVDCILSHVVAMRNPALNSWLTSIMRHPSRMELFRIPDLRPVFEKYEVHGIRVADLYQAYEDRQAGGDDEPDKSNAAPATVRADS